MQSDRRVEVASLQRKLAAAATTIAGLQRQLAASHQPRSSGGAAASSLLSPSHVGSAAITYAAALGESG